MFSDFELEYYEIPEEENLLLFSKGNNKKKLLVATPTEITGEMHALLRKILLAINYDLDEDCLLLTGAQGKFYPLISLPEESSPSHAFLFGVSPMVFGLQIPSTAYRPVKIANCTLVLADPLDKLMTDATAKQHLWAILKEEFK